jgi:hypothetical protein
LRSRMSFVRTVWDFVSGTANRHGS